MTSARRVEGIGRAHDGEEHGRKSNRPPRALYRFSLRPSGRPAAAVGRYGAVGRWRARVASSALRLYRPRVVEGNLAHAFPGLSAPSREAIAASFRARLARTLDEVASLPHATRDDVTARVDVQGLAPVFARIESGQRVLCLGAHRGNWELALLAVSARLAAEVTVTYQPLRNRWLDGRARALRSRFGARVMTGRSSLRSIAAGRPRAGAWLFLADQRPLPDERARALSLLGRTTTWSRFPEALAFRADAVFFFDVVAETQGRYRLECSSLPKGEVLAAYVGRLEEGLRGRPDDWLWTHRRWPNAVSG